MFHTMHEPRGLASYGVVHSPVAETLVRIVVVLLTAFFRSGASELIRVDVPADFAFEIEVRRNPMQVDVKAMQLRS